LHSNLRFVISASLVGCAGLIGVLALLPPTLEERLLASAELSAAPAPACNQQNWLRFDRNCLSRRGMPWVADLPVQKEHPSPVESAPAQAADTQASVSTQSDTSTGSAQSNASTASAQSETSAQSDASTASAQFETSAQSAASTQSFASTQSSAAAAEKLAQPSEAAAPSDVTASRQEAPVPAPIADAPQVATQQSEVPQQEPSALPLTGERRAVKQRNVTRHAAPPPVATERRVAKPVVESQPPAPKKPAREARGAKPRNEALNAVRKFQDNLRDIPVSSYASDGTQRTIVIRPTSIQDVYYYSAPR
jgi:hypothetical protein